MQREGTQLWCGAQTGGSVAGCWLSLSRAAANYTSAHHVIFEWSQAYNEGFQILLSGLKIFVEL